MTPFSLEDFYRSPLPIVRQYKLVYFPVLMMEAKFSPKTGVYSYRTKQRDTEEDGNRHTCDWAR
jgi:hypothetical protein